MKGLGELAAVWPQLNELLDEALSLPAPERMSWLHSLPVEHASLKNTLARLLDLRAQAETGDFLGTLPKLDGSPGPMGAQFEAGAPHADGEVGPYRLIRELGAGGMGSVWLAERADGSLKRHVALKLPHHVWAADLASRMARERDILASMEHPNIARLYDAGVDALGRPWLALEFVDGKPIDVHCRERGLSIQERVALLIQVCEAVAYAHARLIVHRDLKPSNVLVTTAGAVKLLDFGIARLLEGERADTTALTQANGRVLTPDYASPEQIRGEPLGTASDVYSLGVLAYELLAGTRPYRLGRGNAAELDAAVARASIASASSRAASTTDSRALRGDLDAIVSQALRSTLDQRYPTVQEFANDLRRWCRREPVKARSPSAVERLRLFISRHRLPVASGAVVAVALLAGTGVAVWQARQAQAARVVAEQEAQTAKAVQAYLESVFLENRGDQAAPGTSRQTSARDLLDRGAARIASELTDQPAARLRLLQVLAGMYEDLNEFDRMRELSELRVAQARTLPGPRRDRELVLALADLAHALAISGRESDARASLDEAESLLQQRVPTDHAARLSVLLRRGSVHRADDPARAAAAAEAALALAMTLPPSLERVLAAFLAAEARNMGGEPARAVPILNDVVALVERRPELGASVLAPLYTLLGDAHVALGQLQEAEAGYRRAVEVERARGTAGVTPNYLALQLGQFLLKQDRWREALEVLRPAWAWSSVQRVDFETTVPMASVTYGRALVALGRLDEGMVALDRAAEQAQLLQDAPDIVARIEALRASAWLRGGSLRSAEQALSRADKTVAERKLRTIDLVEQARRQVLVAQGRSADALASWRAERESAGLPVVPAAGPEPAALVESARWHLVAGRAESALQQARAASAEFETAAAAGSPHANGRRAKAAKVWGESLLALNRPSEAADVLVRSVALLRPEVDDTLSLDFADSLMLQAEAQRRSGSLDQAAAARREAMAIQARQRRAEVPRRPMKPR